MRIHNLEGRIGDEGATSLAKLTRLRELEINTSRVRVLGIFKLCGLRKIRRITIDEEFDLYSPTMMR